MCGYFALVGEDDLPRYTRSTRDDDYWLSQAAGFVVESAAGRIGVVEGVRFLSRIDRPDVLVIRAGRFGRRRLDVPIDAVEEIRPREKRIRLRDRALLEEAD